ncbi:DNA-binding transcriptional regulator, AcrR family [Amycolatopsis arida]|uniref:DNA-binding transcriptional regulator, AcrR family n=1 Tax=Amycolatopsis arida TaxID=587909 RepID=A0A1I5ZF74_9PSEU|nr:TetR/AcrR family transcriptional regulator [Amycolatopsis arida]TDX89614.1 AcrR family transcriptional regulator [Amycolatopsis arida]SFQ55085.1 DNA-binding transcriptional regulator, AcrR family [Amycolatopsis arida]
MVTTSERGREVRRRLLSAATELIAERGWTGVSTRALADRAEVAPGLVHYHFASLRALLTEAAIEALRNTVADLDEVITPARTPEEGVELVLASLAQFSGTDPLSLLVTETYLAATRDPELCRRVGEIAVEFRRRIAGWLGHWGVADPDHTAMVVVATLDGLVLHRALDPTVSAPAVAGVLRRIVARPRRPTDGGVGSTDVSE